MFQDKNLRAQAVAVPLFYGIVEAVAIGLYCVWAWKVGWTKAPKDEHICVVVSKTYEVDSTTENDDDEEDDCELDPEAGDSENGEEDVVVVDTKRLAKEELTLASGEEQTQVIPGSGGFWSHVLPPALIRWTSSILSRQPRVTSRRSLGKASSDVQKRTSKGKNKRGAVVSGPARHRLGTADTSICSGMSNHDTEECSSPAFSCQSSISPADDPVTVPVRLESEVMTLQLPSLEERIENSSEDSSGTSSSDNNSVEEENENDENADANR